MLLILLIIGIVQAECPSDCNCLQRTLSCSICLRSFFQVYNVTTSDCNCKYGFQKFNGGGDYCCPLTCGKCYYKGCATCAEHAQKYWNETLRFYDCSCEEKYYELDGECVCLSNKDPVGYYYDYSKLSCFKCPYECTCNTSGCVSCKESANRTIIQYDNSKIICPCSGVLNDINGTCTCYEGCICEDNFVISCSDDSHRFDNTIAWPCKSPYNQINYTCVCTGNFVEISVFNNTQCVCKSKVNFTEYYEIDGQCFKCNQACTCDNRGCVRCSNAFWQITHFSCYCANGSIEVNGQCSCIDPYYYNGTNGSCFCLSDLFPTKYYQTQQKCLPCPTNCICSSEGCFSCSTNSMRTISTDSNNKSVCNCIKNAIQSDGRCDCKLQYYYQPTIQQCECQNQRYPSLVYFHNSICSLCPFGCNCNASGCFSCANFSNRNTMSANGVFICQCMATLIDEDGQCTCNIDSIYNRTTRECQCVEPYFTAFDENNNSYCQCKSTVDPKNYYIDEKTHICSICPFGCLCDPSGCFDCDPLTLRFIDYIYDSTFVFRCPCLQNSFFVNGTCTICDIKSYFNGVACTPCLQCLKCNKLGCTQCNLDMTLIDAKCICNNENLTNINGFCICPKGTYLNIFQEEITQCLVCPKNCKTCSQSNNILKCTACLGHEMKRQAVSESNCPCMEGYTEANPKKEFCCLSNCEDCNLTHCLSCPLYTFRTVVSGQCQCQQPYQQIGNTVCGCSSSAFYYNQSCLSCPPGCLSCQITSTESINCPSCISNSNRNFSSTNCSCLHGFYQTVPQQHFCVAQYCKTKSIICQQCYQNMIVNQNGICVCPIGYFKHNLQGCQKCAISGCLKCQTQNTCLWCNQSSGFYLVQRVCLKITLNNYILAQHEGIGLVIQFKIDQNINLDQQKTSGTIYKIQSPNSTTFSSPIPINIYYIQQNDDIITMIVQNPEDQQYDIIISFFLINLNKLEAVSFNMKVYKLLSGRMLLDLNAARYKFVWIYVFFLIAIALVINLKGYKHNQILFYQQTLSFLCYYLGGARFNIAQFLFNMKVAYFKFASGPIYKTIPSLYFQSSQGNFTWLTLDSNIIRLIDLPIFLCGLLIILFIAFSVIYRLLALKINIDTKFVQWKKWLYRLFQFFFKGLMYPIVFFSFNTLLNVNSTVYYASSFKTNCIILSVFFLIFFIIFILLIYHFGQTSNLYKIQMVCQIVIDYAASISLVTSLAHGTIWLPVFCIIIIVKDLTYYFFRRHFTNQKHWVIHLQLLVIILEIVPLFLIFADNWYGMVISLAIVSVSQCTVQLYIIKIVNKTSHYDKLRIKVEEDLGTTAIIISDTEKI